MYKCKCLTCTHVRAMKKLIPGDKLRNKILAVTDDLYEGMAAESIDKDMEILRLTNIITDHVNNGTAIAIVNGKII